MCVGGMEKIPDILLEADIADLPTVNIKYPSDGIKNKEKEVRYLH